ncbi:hypothetical protein GCM10008967_30110 [Bacillus carboniphilus]|uniref:Uncharacterized protein n=1 Tax=Bacillus carboniphilus TaxID=86663 RepID=A0ABP3G8H1_9BACI
MQVQYESSKQTKVVIKREWSTRFLLNVIGGFLFVGLMVTMFTVPYSIDQNGIYQMQEAVLSGKKLKEFIAFTVSAACTYFLLVNLYVWGKLGKKIVYLILLAICIFCMVQVFI